MEKITFLFNEAIHNKARSVLTYPKELQRLLYYSHEVYNYYYANRKETDTHIYWSAVNKRPMYENDRLFYRHVTNCGVTYTKKTKTIKIWFGQHWYNISSEIREDIINHFAPWLRMAPHSVTSLLNATILNHIVKNKITNEKDIITQYLKTSPYKKMDVNVDLFTDVFTNHLRDISPKEFKAVFLASNSINDALNYIKKTYVGYFYDTAHTRLCNAALALNKKIDINMSETAAIKLHDDYMKLITNTKVIYSNLEDVS